MASARRSSPRKHLMCSMPRPGAFRARHPLLRRAAGRRGDRCARRSAAGADAGAGARGRCHPARIGRRTEVGCKLETGAAAREGAAAESAPGSGLFANLRPALLFPQLAAASSLKAGVGGRARHPDRPRTDRRPLLRRAARGPYAGRTASVRASTPMSTASPRSAASAPGLRTGAQARPAVFGGQGQRARGHGAVA
jgi:hypothetical protein